MSPLLTIDTTQTGGPGHSTRPKTSPQGEFTCSKISLAFKTVHHGLLLTVDTFPGTTVGSLARASSPKIRIRRSPSWKNQNFMLGSWRFEIQLDGTIWNSLVGRSLSLILVRRKVTALEWITVHAGWWGEVEPGANKIKIQTLKIISYKTKL